jgi:hypothetical protein
MPDSERRPEFSRCVTCNDLATRDPGGRGALPLGRLDAALEAVRRRRGRVDVGPLDVPSGRFAMVADPQNAALALYAGDFDD